jgi:hypothetical protein
MSNETSKQRECGDCGQPIDDDVDVVRVGPDWFHAACYLPPSMLSEARDRARALGNGDPRDGDPPDLRR